MFYFVGVKGVIRSFRSAQELKSRYSDTSITFGFHSSNSSSSFHSKEGEHLRTFSSTKSNLSPINYWNQPFDEVNFGGIIGNYCPRKPCGLPHYINHFCSPTYFSCAKIVISHDFLLLLRQNSSKPTKPTNT